MAHPSCTAKQAPNIDGCHTTCERPHLGAKVRGSAGTQEDICHVGRLKLIQHLACGPPPQHALREPQAANARLRTQQLFEVGLSASGANAACVDTYAMIRRQVHVVHIRHLRLSRDGGVHVGAILRVARVKCVEVMQAHDRGAVLGSRIRASGCLKFSTRPPPTPDDLSFWLAV